jgi:multidrug efflux system outer membrane protein
LGGTLSDNEQRTSENALLTAGTGSHSGRDIGLGLSLSWELDVWGRIRRSAESARAGLLATIWARRALEIELIADAAQTYFELRQLDRQLEIARGTVRSRKDSLQLVSSRQKHGVSSMLDVRQAENLLYTAEASIPRLEQQIAAHENHLCFLMGSGGVIPRGRSIEDLRNLALVPAGLPSSLLEKRPDILRAEQALVAANANIGAAKAAMFPKLRLTGAAGFTSAELDSLFQGGSFNYAIKPALDQPIFQAGALAGSLRMAKARREEMLAGYESAIQNAFREVSDALVALRKARVYFDEQEKNTVALRDAVRLSYLRYRGGVSDYLACLDSERALFSAEMDLVTARATELIALVQIYRALGGGWRPAPADG